MRMIINNICPLCKKPLEKSENLRAFYCRSGDYWNIYHLSKTGTVVCKMDGFQFEFFREIRAIRKED